MVRMFSVKADYGWPVDIETFEATGAVRDGYGNSRDPGGHENPPLLFLKITEVKIILADHQWTRVVRPDCHPWAKQSWDQHEGAGRSEPGNRLANLPSSNRDLQIERGEAYEIGCTGELSLRYCQCTPSNQRHRTSHPKKPG